jgi:hypothetical protein
MHLSAFMLQSRTWNTLWFPYLSRMGCTCLKLGLTNWFRDNFIENCWKEQHVNYNCLKTVTGWWFGTRFIFHNIYGMSSFPLTNSYFSRWLKHVKTTHQVKRCVKNDFVWGRYLGFMKEHPLWGAQISRSPSPGAFSDGSTEFSYGKLPSNMVDSANEHMDFNVD